MPSEKQRLGKRGEDLAANYLTGRGYTIVERNVRTAYGEIDLVTRQTCPPGRFGLEDGTVTVFVEVKTRTSTAFGYPEASVTPRKQAHLLDSAQAYLQAHPELDGNWRVDVIAIQEQRAGRNPVITHFENALQ